MSAKQTFAFLKPHNSVIQQMIIDYLLANGFVIIRQETRTLDLKTIQSHYPKYVEANFFPGMAEYLMSGPVVLLILERTDDQDPVEFLKNLSGPTDPKKGTPGDIRYNFGVHCNEVIYINAIHRSDPREVDEEIARFFPED